MEGKPSVIYIVDDDASVRTALESLARSVGFEARGFASAAEFLTGEHGSRPACVVLDLQLPDMHGLEVQRRLAKTDPDLMVVVLTGSWDDRTRHEALAAGAVSVLSKPLDPQILLEAMRRALAGPAGEKRP